MAKFGNSSLVKIALSLADLINQTLFNLPNVP